MNNHPDLAAPSIFSDAKTGEAADSSTFHFFTNFSTSSNLDFIGCEHK